MQGGATSKTGPSLNTTSLRQQHCWGKNNYQQQHKEKAIQQIPPTLDKGKKHKPLKKKLWQTTETIILLFFQHFFLAKKVQGSKESTRPSTRAPQKQHSFCGLFNFFGRTQPAYSSKIMCKAVNKRHFETGAKSGRSTKTITTNDKIKYFCFVFWKDVWWYRTWRWHEV